MAVYGFCKIREKFSFKGLLIRFAYRENWESIYITLWQKMDDDNLVQLWSMNIPKTCIDAKDLLIKLKTEYDGEFNNMNVHDLGTEVIIYNKRYEALEWLESIALIDELTNI